MDKLDKLEKALKEYKEMLEKNAQMGYPAIGGMPAGTSGGGSAVNTSTPSQVEKGEDEKDKKEDKKMIEDKMDEHNEKMHGEAKDVDSAKKSDELVKFNELGQWSVTKMDLAPEGKYKASHKEVMNGDDGKVEVGPKSVDGDKGKTVENKKRG